MSKETDELEAAKAKIDQLTRELAVAVTPKQENKTEVKLNAALERLEVLEQKYEKTDTKGGGGHKREEEELEADGDQCPVCGHVLSDMGSGEWYCPGCEEYFEEEE